jgi:hypothetical protein
MPRRSWRRGEGSRDEWDSRYSYLAKEGTPPSWDERARQVAALPWPEFAPSSVSPVCRGHAAAAASDDFLSRLADRLPRAVDPVVAEGAFGTLLDQMT